MTEWPVFDPGSRTLSDLFEYEVEIEVPVEADVDFELDEETTDIGPPAWLT